MGAQREVTMEEIIYEKRYPKESMENFIALTDWLNRELSQKPVPSFDQFQKRLEEDYIYILIPHRQRIAKKFVWIAREISELYELDVKITKHVSHISVDYYFGATSCMRYLKDVIKFADDISFFANIEGYKIVLCLDCYTHAVYHRGRRIYP